MRVLALSMASMVLAAGIVSAEEADGTFDRSLTVSGAVDLDVTTDSGGITVRAGSSGTVRIHAILKAQHSWFGSDDALARIHELERHPPIEQIGNRVRIGYVQTSGLLRNISIRYEIETPSDTQLRARADSGGIDASGIHGPADCKTDSGGIEIRDVGADVHAVADSGGIHIDNVKGLVFARVDSGGVTATHVAGALDVQTDSGGIRVSQTTAAPIRAKADSGSVSVSLAPGAGYDISAEAESGSISTPEMTVSSSFSRHHVAGKVHGGGPLVNIRVDSGGISIN